MMDWMIGTGIIAFIYVYLYASVKQNAEGLQEGDTKDYYTQGIKLLFLSLALFSMLLISWAMYITPNMTSSFNVTTVGNQTTITPIPNEMTDSLLVYFQANLTVAVIIIGLSILFFFKDMLMDMEASRKRKEVGGVY